jgi:hypothetical protein
MKKLLALRRIVPLLAVMGVLAAPADAQVPGLDSIKNQEELDKAVASLDTALFDAYNRCDLEKFSSFFVDDVEFYHDQGGVTLGRQNLTDSVKKNICGKVTRERRSGDAAGPLHEGLWRGGDGRAPLPPPGARGHRARG